MTKNSSLNWHNITNYCFQNFFKYVNGRHFFGANIIIFNRTELKLDLLVLRNWIAVSQAVEPHTDVIFHFGICAAQN